MAKHDAPPETPSAASPAAIALALNETPRSDEVGAKAALFLDEQTRMLRLQMEHLHEERNIHHRHLRLKYFGDRLRVGLELLAIAFGLAIVIGLGAMVWQAHEDHGLVVEAFSVPPDLAARGLTGQVVAEQVLDRLASLQQQTASARPAGSYKSNWGDDLKVEIPQTGVSLGDVRRFLRQWLGHETRISGEVFRAPSGLTLSARVGEEAAQRFSGDDAQFDRLIEQGAEAVYEQTQPYRYAVYLSRSNRRPEALAIFRRLAVSDDRDDRAWANNGLGIDAMAVGNDPAEAAARFKEALRDRPNFAPALRSLMTVEVKLGYDEEALRTGLATLRAFDRFAGEIDARYRAGSTEVTESQIDTLRGDYLGAARHDALAAGSRLAVVAHRGRQQAPFDLLYDHNLSAARAAAAVAAAAVAGPDVPSALTVGGFDPLSFPGLIVLELGDPGAVAALQADAQQALAQPNGAQTVKVAIWPLLAMAKALAGDQAGAEALIAGTPLDCYKCVIQRGRIASLKHDWAGAAQWFAVAARQGPDLPQAFHEWGAMLFAKGDLAGAIAKFDLAHQKGPHFADPLELWGEALMRSGDPRGAAAKFAEADKYAPRWGRNHLRWGQALAAQGKRADATAQFTAARGMDLSAADRLALAKLS